MDAEMEVLSMKPCCVAFWVDESVRRTTLLLGASFWI